MDRIWLKSYPQGVPAEIEADGFVSLGAMFAQSVQRYRHQTAFECLGARLSYARLDHLSRDFAAYLQGVLKLPPGERVAIMLPNVLQYPVCMLGALRGGYVVVNCNPLYTARELEYQLVDCAARSIVILENFAHTLESIIGKTQINNVIVARLGDLLGFPRGMAVNWLLSFVRRQIPAWHIDGACRFRAVLAKGRKMPFVAPEVRRDDIAFLQYTGGTTGVSKGAMLSHGNMLANIEQTRLWSASLLQPGEERVVTVLPLYHIFALTANCLLFLRLGASNLLVVNPRDLQALVATLARHPLTVLIGVNTLFSALLDTPRFAALDFRRLKVCLAGGAAVHKSVAERWQRTTGKVLIEAYGLTETSPALTVNPLDATDFNGSVGLPLPSTEVLIRDDDGNDLPLGERGELCARGPQVMQGYYRQKEETANVMSSDGFLRTGDMAVMDARGYVTLVDRKKDLIIVSGFNVYPNEVEEVLALHPEILEAAAIGVPDAKTGEAVKVFVVRRHAALNAEQVIAHCREYLTSYKLPVQVEFCAELPKTPVGKLLRRALRDAVPGF